MGRLAKLISEATGRHRQRLIANGPAAAKVIDSAIQEVLGVQGSPGNHAPAGDAPRRQSGRLASETRAIFDAEDLSTAIVTNEYGAILNRRNHPFLKRIVALALPAWRKAITKP